MFSAGTSLLHDSASRSTFFLNNISPTQWTVEHLLVTWDSESFQSDIYIGHCSEASALLPTLLANMPTTGLGL